jgi:long-chain acyl-CoA synthetase
MNLPNSFEASAKRQQAKAALFWGERVYSYTELWNQTLTISAGLREEFGVKSGDRVGLWLKNCPEFIPAFFGVLHAGAVVVPINNFLKTDEVNYILADAGIDVLISDAELGAHHHALATHRPGLKLLKVESLARPSERAHAWQTDCRGRREESSRMDASGKETPDVVSYNRHEISRLEGEASLQKSRTSRSRSTADLAVLIYTSGTTGRPKGAMLSHSNLLHNVESCRIVLQTVEADRFVVLLPLFHSYMLTVGMLLPLLVGGSMVLVKSVHPVRNVLQEVIQRQATVLPAIPQFYRSIVNATGHPPLPLRVCISGAAPLPLQVLREFESKFGIPLIEGYGLSEASPVVTKNPLDRTRKPGSIGPPIPNVEVSIQDDNGHELPVGSIGELCVRGGNVMLGYWNKPEETAAAFRNGWLLTGDVGYRDAEGYYFITDRKKDMLLVNGINVYPREIEEVLYQFPGIREAAVVGKPDSRKGEQPVAFISAIEGVDLDEKEIQHFVRHRLADYKVPRQIVLLPALPRNATGKILKTALREIPISDERA